MFVASHELPPEAFEMQDITSEDIPIMPLVVKTLFVSNLTGENISNVRRLLYKVRKLTIFCKSNAIIEIRYVACLQSSYGSFTLHSTLQSDWSGGTDLTCPC